MAKRKGTVLIGTPSQLADEPDPLTPRTTEPGDEPAASSASRAAEPEPEPPSSEPEPPRSEPPSSEPDPEPDADPDADPPSRSRGRGATWQGPLDRDAVAPPEPTDEVASRPRKGPDPEHDARPTGSTSFRISIPRPSDDRPSSQLPQRNTTTFIELNAVAERLTMATAEKVPIGRQIALSSAAGLLLVLLVIGVLVSGTARWVLLGGVFLVVAGLLVFGAARALPRLAERYGSVELPGGIKLWLGVATTILAASAGVLTWGLSEATATLAGAAFPRLRPEIPEEAEPAPPPPEPVERADAKMRLGQQVRLRPGLLYAPPNFTSEDGSFDLIVHFHGNTELVEQSVAEAKVNALVQVTNLGLRSTPYKQWAAVPDAFDRLLDDAVDKAAELGLRDPKLRRVALSSWSAGYGAMLHILDKPRHRDRIDAVLITDGMHGGFRTEAEREIHPASLAAFVAFAERAAQGDKLFVVTHSRIQTHGYASSSASADYLLAQLGIERNDTSDSPPHVDFDVAVKAFPADGKRWLEGRTEAQRKGLHVYGYAGNTAEDHIAHLAQMAVTVLPLLRERWE